MTDWINPGYYEAKRMGRMLPMKPMSRTVIKRKPLTGLPMTPLASYKAKNDPNYNAFQVVTNGGPIGWLNIETFQYPTVSGLQSKAELVSLARGNIGDQFDALTFIAEFGKSADMLLTAGRRAIETLVAIKKAIKRGDRLALDKTIAQLWLEGRFGWRPLVKEMNAIVEVLAGKEVKYLRAGAYDTKSVSLDHTLNSSYGPYTKLKVRATTTETRRVRIFAEVQNSAAGNGIQINPLATAWEVIPLSVFIDMFIDIGGWLRSISLACEMKSITVAYTTEIVKTAELTGYYRVNSPSGATAVTNCNVDLPIAVGGLIHHETVNRTIEDGLGFPDIRLPALDQWIDIAALITTLIKSR